MAEVKTQEFQRASVKALADAKLQSLLGRSMGTFDGARQEAIEEPTPQRWEEMREKGRAIKRHTLHNLDYYLELLYDRVTQNGRQVHFARDPQEARNIVGQNRPSPSLTSARKCQA